jgi:hypothetical protein
MTQEALKLALEALEWCHGGEPCGTAEAITAIKKALAQEQEPVAWQFMNGSNFRKRRPDDFVDLDSDGLPYWKPLYTTPPQRTWVGLTDDEIKTICSENGWDSSWQSLRFARAIEAKLKQKNG